MCPFNLYVLNGEAYRKTIEVWRKLPKPLGLSRHKVTKPIQRPTLLEFVLNDSSYQEAKTVFETMLHADHSLFKVVAEWNLAMTYLKLDDDTSLKKILEVIIQQKNHLYREQAEELLRKISAGTRTIYFKFQRMMKAPDSTTLRHIGGTMTQSFTKRRITTSYQLSLTNYISRDFFRIGFLFVAIIASSLTGSSNSSAWLTKIFQ